MLTLLVTGREDHLIKDTYSNRSSEYYWGDGVIDMCSLIPIEKVTCAVYIYSFIIYRQKLSCIQGPP